MNHPNQDYLGYDASWYDTDYELAMNTWSFEPPSGSPLKAKSQYVTIQWPTAEELSNQPTTYQGYAWYKFIIDSNTRDQILEGGRKRRSVSDRLEELEQLENEALSSIMSDSFFPADVSVVVTTPIDRVNSEKFENFHFQA